MKMQGRFGLAAAVLLVIPTLASAQQHAMGSFRAAPNAPSAAPAVHSFAVQTHTGTRTSGARMVTAAPTGMGAGDHLAAIDHSKDIKALIDPATQARLAERHRRRKPKTFNGFIFLDGGGAYVLPVDAGAGLNGDVDAQVAQDQGQDQGQVQSAPQERAQQELQQQEQLDASNARLAEEQSASLPDEGEFTLILRSGQEIEAVAFTRVDDRIVYVTVGGGRRTVAVRDVDVDATVRLNQERGTPLQISL